MAERDPEQAKDEIREKLERGDEPTDEEKQFIGGENVELEDDRGTRVPSDLTG